MYPKRIISVVEEETAEPRESPLDQATPFDLKYAAPGKTVPSLNCKVPRCIALPLIYHDWTGSRFHPPVLTVYRLQQPCFGGVGAVFRFYFFFIPEMCYCLSFSLLYAGPLCSKDIGFKGHQEWLMPYAKPWDHVWATSQHRLVPMLRETPGVPILSDTSIF